MTINFDTPNPVASPHSQLDPTALLRLSINLAQTPELRAFLIDVFVDIVLRELATHTDQGDAPVTSMFQAAQRTQHRGIASFEERGALYCAAFVKPLGALLGKSLHPVNAAPDTKALLYDTLRPALASLERRVSADAWRIRAALGLMQEADNWSPDALRLERIVQSASGHRRSFVRTGSDLPLRQFLMNGRSVRARL